MSRVCHDVRVESRFLEDEVTAASLSEQGKEPGLREELLKKGVAFVSGKRVGGIVTGLEEFIYCSKQSFGVGAAGVCQMRVVGGLGGFESFKLFV